MVILDGPLFHFFRIPKAGGKGDYSPISVTLHIRIGYVNISVHIQILVRRYMSVDRPQIRANTVTTIFRADIHELGPLFGSLDRDLFYQSIVCGPSLFY